MKKMLMAVACAMLLSPAYANASWFGSDGPKDTDEITPLQYSALLGLRDIDPVMFRSKLLPLIDEAMKDGKITVGECKEIEKAAGNVAPAFYKAARTPSFQESLTETMDKAARIWARNLRTPSTTSSPSFSTTPSISSGIR